MTRRTFFEQRSIIQRARVGDALTKYVLITLHDYYDDSGSCYPGVEELARATELSDRTVRTILGALAAAGLIRRKRRYDEDGRRAPDAIAIEFGRLDALRLGGSGSPPLAGGLPANPAGEPAARTGDLPANGAFASSTGTEEITPPTGARETPPASAGGAVGPVADSSPSDRARLNGRAGGDAAPGGDRVGPGDSDPGVAPDRATADRRAAEESQRVWAGVFKTRWDRRFGRTYTFDRAVDGRHLKYFREAIRSLELWEAVVDGFVRSDDRYLVSKGHTLGALRTCWQRFAGTPTHTRAPPVPGVRGGEA